MGSDPTPLSYKPVAGGAGFFFSTSVPTLPVAISRSAITVDLSRFGSTSGEAPAPSWRAREVAASVSWKRLGILFRQSSTVMRAMFFALSADDVGELLPSVVEVIVNYSVFELAGVRQLLARVLHAALDDVLGILPAGAHAPLQLLDRRRQDEDADRVGIELAHLLRALPVDFEDQVVAALQRIEDQLLRSAVAVAVHLGALEKLAAAAHGEECRVVDEMVVDAVLLARARRSRGVRDGEPEARVFPHQRVDQRRLARPRRRGDDEQKPAHSMFCTCSRICSTRSLSSSAQSDSCWLAAFEASVLASRLSSWAMKSSRLPTAPPCLSVRSASPRCARRRSSSSSTSTLAANTASSARTRSSSAVPSASRSRSASLAW